MLTLVSGQVHLWQQTLAVTPARLRQLGALLSPDEQQKASRFCREQSRQQYAVSRGSLRLILSRYMMIEPQEIRFGYGPQGKPFLANDIGMTIDFNLSHSGQLVLIAIGRDRSLGIDLEQVRTATDIVALSEQCFSPDECRLLTAYPPDQKHRVFFQLWTCKEALLKATGVGLRDIEHIEIVALPQTPSRQVQFSQRSSRQFSLQLIVDDPDYIAALAVERKGQNWLIR